MSENVLKNEKNMPVIDMVYIAVSAVLIAICSWITIPAPVPFTLQTFAVFVVTALIGWKRGTFAVLLYVLLGIIGLPVFAGFTGGFGVIAGPLGGYILGFIGLPLMYGFITSIFGKKTPSMAAGLAAGELVVYIVGTIWFVIAYSSTKGAVTVMQALGWCVFPFILPDAVKLAVALFIAKRVQKSIRL